MEKENDHSVRIISPNQEDRLEVVTYLLQFDQLMCSNVNSPTANGKNATNKLQKLLRDLNEPILGKSLIQTAAVNFKEIIMDLIESGKFNADKIRKMNRGEYQPPPQMAQTPTQQSSSGFQKLGDNILSSSTMPDRKSSVKDEPIMIEDDPPDTNVQFKKLQEKGTKIFKIISEKYPDWNEIEVQEKIFNEIDRCNRDKIDLNTKEILDFLSAKFAAKDDIMLVDDDPPPSDYEISGDIVDAWFIENYEESPASNMAIYKKELYKQFLSHFDLRYRQGLSYPRTIYDNFP